jgi:type IV secretory pathway TrbD component
MTKTDISLRLAAAAVAAFLGLYLVFHGLAGTYLVGVLIVALARVSYTARQDRQRHEVTARSYVPVMTKTDISLRLAAAAVGAFLGLYLVFHGLAGTFLVGVLIVALARVSYTAREDRRRHEVTARS